MEGFWCGKRVLVAGGAGFIGSHVVDLLLERGAYVRIVDNFERGTMANLTRPKDLAGVIVGDLRSPEACANAVRGQEVVLNFAAKVAGLFYNKNHHSDMLTANVQINSNLLTAAEIEGVDRFCVISTAAVYPYDSPYPTPEVAAEDGPPGASEEGYGWAKLLAEKEAQYHYREKGTQICIARLYNVFGPKDHFDDETSHVLPALIKRALSAANRLKVFGSGGQTRSFIFAKDCARAVLDLVPNYSVADPTNIGSTEEITVAALATLILQLLGRDLEIEFDRSQPEGHARKLPDTRKFQAVVGREPASTSLLDGLRATIDWYLQSRSCINEVAKRR